MSNQRNIPLRKLAENAIDVDQGKVKADVKQKQRKYSGESRESIAKRVIRGTSWKTFAQGTFTGLPSNVLAAAGAGLTDAALTLRAQMEMAARVAYLYDRTFFEDRDAMWELFVPLMGATKASRIAKHAGIRAGKNLTRRAIKRFLSNNTLKAFKKATLKVFGKKVLQKTVISKTIPVVSSAISGGWNLVETRVVGGRVIDYFDGKAIGQVAA